jgi:hypothetical protein
LIAGAIVSVLIGTLWTGGGAGVALLIPLFAVVLCPLGVLLGWIAESITRRRRP